MELNKPLPQKEKKNSIIIISFVIFLIDMGHSLPLKQGKIFMVF